MHLLVLDQIAVTSLSSDVLRPKDVIEVSDTLGAELLTRHPRAFRAVHQAEEAAKGRKKKPASKPEGE